MAERADKRRVMGDRTRERLVASARAQFEAHGYAGATVRAISSGAAVSTGAFFAHFPSKAAIYRDANGHQPITADQGRKLLLALHWALKEIDTLEAYRKTYGARPSLKYESARRDAENVILEVGEAILSDAP